MPDLTVQIGRALSFPDPRREERPHRLLVRFVAKLDTLTTHVNPAFARAREMGRRADPERERIKLLQVDEAGIASVPRGCLQEVRDAAKACGVLLTWDPEVVSNGTRTRTVEEVEAGASRAGFKLRQEYQPAIIQTILAKRQGMVVLPCGGGKTISGVAAVHASGEAALVLVHTEDLLDQWIGAIRFVTGRDPRVIGSGHHDPRPLSPGEVAVGMIQTLQPNLETYRGLMESVGFLLVDECHRAPADLFAQVINACPGRFRIGLSATPNRADGYGFLIHAMIGPTIFRLPRGARDLIEWGYLHRPMILPVATGYDPPPSVREWIISCPECAKDKRRARRAVQVLSSSEEKDAYSAGRLSCKRKGRKSVRCSYVFTGQEKKELGQLVLAQVVTDAMVDPHRVRLMGDLAQVGVKHGRRVLSLVTRKEGVSALERDHRGRGIRVRGVTSSTPKDERSAIISGFRSGRYQSMIATQLADEGLDVPALDLLVMGSGGRHDGTAQQRAGRVCRIEGHPVPVVLDLVDAYNSARSQWRERASAYVEAYGPECLPTDRPLPATVAAQALEMLAEGRTFREVAAFVKVAHR